ncbi:MAG TPA: hypothetical protein VGV93_02485 [Acidimicrobiales bacterium]|nr:hypothetical protein [Acidimicrobiales bacterium]
MTRQRTSTVEELPIDPVGEAIADGLTDVLTSSVELAYAPAGTVAPHVGPAADIALATGPGPHGWQVSYIVRLDDRLSRLISSEDRSSLKELLHALPSAAVHAAAQLRGDDAGSDSPAVGSALRRAIRDMVAAEILAQYMTTRLRDDVLSELMAATIEFLIELSGTRVESHDLTHGVIVADVPGEPPRLRFAYPDDIRAAKRAPLLFDGQRSVLVVDPEGRARTEVQRHRLERLADGPEPVLNDDDSIESGSLVAEATRLLGGIGFFLRADRSIWTFVDGHPLLVRRGEHWTAFPLELTASIESMIGCTPVAALVAQAAFMISAQPGGAILAIVDDAALLDGVVSLKDRYDLRNDVDRAAMRPETRLHHLIDAENLDEQILVRLATLDGATVLDRRGRLVAYGAIVASADSEHEGARTAAAKTLSNTADVVLKVSVDGDITIFRAGQMVTTLLAASPDRH